MPPFSLILWNGQLYLPSTARTKLGYLSGLPRYRLQAHVASDQLCHLPSCPRRLGMYRESNELALSIKDKGGKMPFTGIGKYLAHAPSRSIASHESLLQ